MAPVFLLAFGVGALPARAGAKLTQVVTAVTPKATAGQSPPSDVPTLSSSGDVAAFPAGPNKVPWLAQAAMIDSAKRTVKLWSYDLWWVDQEEGDTATAIAQKKFKDAVIHALVEGVDVQILIPRVDPTTVPDDDFTKADTPDQGIDPGTVIETVMDRLEHRFHNESKGLEASVLSAIRDADDKSQSEDSRENAVRSFDAYFCNLTVGVMPYNKNKYEGETSTDAAKVATFGDTMIAIDDSSTEFPASYYIGRQSSSKQPIGWAVENADVKRFVAGKWPWPATDASVPPPVRAGGSCSRRAPTRTNKK